MISRKEEQQAIRVRRMERVKELIAEGKEDYVHLHGHDYHSVRDSISKPEKLMEKAKEYGMWAIAVTNHGNANGWVEEAEAAAKAGIKFIPGVEIYDVDDHTIHSKNEMQMLGHMTCHMVLLAITEEGYFNLIKIISEAGTTGKFDGKNRISMDWIEKNHLGRGIRMTSACLGGRVAKLATNGRLDEAIAFMKRCRDIFDEAYVEIQDSGILEQEIYNLTAIQDIAPGSGCPLILNRDYHYVEKAHGDYHDTLKAIAYGHHKHDSCRGSGKYPSLDAYYLGPPSDMWDYIRSHGLPPEIIYNGIELAEACTAKVVTGKSFFPKFPKLPEGYTERTYLRKQVMEGLLNYFEWCVRHGETLDVNEYLERINYELSVISQKGYDGYFLIIWDVINWCNQNGIITGPGRGSAAGSLLSFGMKITRLDPIKRGLLFERFLNPFRESWPDIDFDIPRKSRHRVMGYVLDTYGKDFVSQIITFGTMGLKSGVRDIIKALHDPEDPDCPYTEDLAKWIASCIPDKMPDQGEISLKRVTDIAENPDKYIDLWGEKKANSVIPKCQEFMTYMAQYPEVHEHLQILEGTIMNTGLHAGGVIICPQPIREQIPVELSKGDTAVLPVACWDSGMAESAGFMKMDFLGLATLDVVDLTFGFIEKSGEPRPDMYEIGREDPAVFKAICDGFTHGGFQIGGGGLTEYLKQARPQDMDGWCDVIALYRPGPLDAKIDKSTTIAQKYVENADPNALADWMEELNPALRPLLKRTRGVMVYQEQVMQICQVIAGYSLGDADTFRRIIGKKKVSEVRALRYQFVYGGEGALKHVQKLISDLDPQDKDEQEKLEEAYKVLKKNKNTAKGGLANGHELDFLNGIYDQMVAFAGYAFNRSHSDVYADLGYVTIWSKVRYPAQFMAALLSVEDKPEKMDGHYAEVKRLGIPLLPPDIEHSGSGFTVEKTPEGYYAIRLGLVSIKGLGVKVADEIVAKRPFNDFEDFVTKIDKRIVNRSYIEKLCRVGAFDHWESNRYQLFNTFLDNHIADKKAKRLDAAGYSEKVGLADEKELLGIYVSSHPFDNLPYQPLSTVRDRETIDIGGQILNIKKINSRRGEMAFVTVQTQNEKMDVTFFSDTWEGYKDRLWKDGIMIFRVRKDAKPDKTSFIAEKVLLPKKSQIGNATAAERPDDVPKKDKAKSKKKQMTLDDLGGAEIKDDPLLELFG